MLSARLTYLRKRNKKTQEDMAKFLGITRPAYTAYESGRRQPDYETLQKLANFFNVSVDYLLGQTNIREFDIVDIFQNEDVKITAAGTPLTQDQRVRLLKAINDIPPVNTTAYIPVLRQIQAGAPLLSEENWESQIEVPSLLKANFALRVEGDSMTYAGILNGDTAIFQMSSTAQNGQIVAAGVEEITWEAYLKFYIEENGQTLLRSANPDYKDIEFGPKHRIIGILVGIIRDQSPMLDDYQTLLQVKGHEDKQWVEVMEKAAGYGIKPDKIMSILEMHWEMLNNKK